jgi:hypothetical protein
MQGNDHRLRHNAFESFKLEWRSLARPFLLSYLIHLPLIKVNHSTNATCFIHGSYRLANFKTQSRPCQPSKPNKTFAIMSSNVYRPTARSLEYRYLSGYPHSRMKLDIFVPKAQALPVKLQRQFPIVVLASLHHPTLSTEPAAGRATRKKSSKQE